MKKAAIVTSLVLLAAGSSAHAALTNGNFEAGLTGWTATTVGAAKAVTVALGAVVTDAGPIAASLTGDHYVYTSQDGPGRSLLTQTFRVEAGVNKIFFDIAINNDAGAFITPNTLDYTGEPNQQARFDIIKVGAALDTVDPADIIVAAYQTVVGDPTTQGWRTHEIDVTAQLASYVGQDVVFRFSQVDNQSYFNLAIDNVNVGATQTGVAAVPQDVPVLGPLGLAALSGLLGLLGVGFSRRLRG